MIRSHHLLPLRDDARLQRGGTRRIGQESISRDADFAEYSPQSASCIVLSQNAVKSFRRWPAGTRERALAAGSLALLVAGMTAGLFEYNFGDSEFLMLFLFAMAIPNILERNSPESRQGEGRVS